ncbi:MAG: hypothetical protein E7453_06080 [Ruminococcaceae bacterium]|nr:hypothetical protein [Oscillospiraceae bacterium]
MKDLIDVTEQVVYELDLAQTVMGYILDAFEGTDEVVRENLKNNASRVFNMLIISNNYLYENKNRLEEAANAYYQQQKAGKSNE